jgi:hypothetical protein
MDPPQAVRAALDSIMGTSYRWYPVIGNHELPGEGSETAPGANLAWLRAWPTAYGYPRTRSGPAPCPETTYSFDIGQVHFVALNVYCDTAGDSATVGDIPDLLYNWLAQDLAATRQPYIIVLGHEPAYPQPDAMVGGSARHLGDSLDAYPTNRDRFWELLEQYRVTAYLTGHTHGYSVFQRDGVWQVDAGHARGLGDVSTPSTFLVFTVGPTSVTMRTYRADYLEEGANAAYRLVYSLVLEGHEVNLAPACH